jgi:hypothetical protein
MAILKGGRQRVENPPAGFFLIDLFQQVESVGLVSRNIVIRTDRGAIGSVNRPDRRRTSGRPVLRVMESSCIGSIVFIIADELKNEYHGSGT